VKRVVLLLVAVILEQLFNLSQSASKPKAVLLHIFKVPDLDPKTGCPDRILAQIPSVPR
jgi:hypothetical protein